MDDGHAKHAAPGELELVRQFLNTHDVEEGVDEISAPDRLRAWLVSHHLESGALATLNEVAAGAQLLVRFDERGQTVLEPAGAGAEAALGELLAIVFRSMAEGTWDRLKACRAETCQWAFYDRSKNRSATWCSMEVCGNRAKARAYRARQKAG
jgi:predicted RNA-binding Zn ribbon-like protein